MFYVLVAAGLCLLLIGGEFLVRGAIALARRLGVSPLIIGLTVVAYGTSAPELLVSLEANLSGSPGIAIGNVVGSNIANVLLIVGLSAAMMPIACAPGSIRLTGPVVLGATGLLVLFGWSGAISPWASAPMLAGLVGFTVFSYRAERARFAAGCPGAGGPLRELEEFEDGPKSLSAILAALGLGLVGVVLGSHFLITGAVGLARAFGVSEATIGLTLVALGTSLPELATAIVAAYHRHSDVALGNVVGSNIFNTLGIMGIVPFFGTIPVPPRMMLFDMWVMLGVTTLFIVWIMVRHSLGRIMASLFLTAYGFYIACHYFGLFGLSALAALPQ